jgi:hypothetical protein
MLAEPAAVSPAGTMKTDRRARPTARLFGVGTMMRGIRGMDTLTSDEGTGDTASGGPSAMLAAGYDLVMSVPLHSPVLCRLWFRPRAVRRARFPNGAPVWLWVARSTVPAVCIERTPLGRAMGGPYTGVRRRT